MNAFDVPPTERWRCARCGHEARVATRLGDQPGVYIGVGAATTGPFCPVCLIRLVEEHVGRMAFVPEPVEVPIVPPVVPPVWSEAFRSTLEPTAPDTDGAEPEPAGPTPDAPPTTP